MPLALYVEIVSSWGLGHVICNLWVSFDVTCCTASILNLCTISIDRYLTITRPLTYGVNASVRRSYCFIGVIWIASCLISVPPLLVFGNEHGSTEQPECQVSQNIIYQLYATLGAFYIPLLVMIVMYYKIYAAAKKVVEAEMKAQPSSCKEINSNNSVKIMANISSSKRIRRSKHHQNTPPSHDVNLPPHDHRESSPCPVPVVSESIPRNSFILLETAHQEVEPNEGDRFLEDPPRVPSEEIKMVSSRIDHNLRNGSPPSTHHQIYHQQHYQEPIVTTTSLLKSSSKELNRSTSYRNARHSSSCSATFHPNSRTGTLSSARSASDLRERKASVTLGVIMTAFTVCWLPFFILALMRPFSIYNIPQWIVSFALWLGYANSMLNPIIYVTFHQDFRQAFKYLLCLQCATMGVRLRQEAYQSQYGSSRRIRENDSFNNNNNYQQRTSC